MMTVIEIVEGIEWYSPSGDPEWRDCQCARCGSSCGFLDCWHCGGDGEIERDNWDIGTHFERCDTCKGDGGSWHCISNPEWCEANPMPGRSHIKSTAMKPEAWDD